MDEAEAASALLNEHSQRLHGVDSQAAAELRQYWESPDVDFDQDVLVAEAEDGSLAGYVDLGVWGEHVWIDLRGLERAPLEALLERIEARAAERLPNANLIGWAAKEDRLVLGILERAGYEVIRHSFRMEIDLDSAPEPRAPEGTSIRPMQEGEERRFYEAHMQSFADTWMFTPDPFEQWSHWFVKDPSFDPTLWFVAEVGDELAGILIGRASPTESGLGWVRILGVVPPHRRKGVGEALLRHSFAEFARRGFERAGLGVDAQSPTGAVRLYERAGMHVARTSLQLEKKVQP
jgi:ribosomal protein S18 acetylase RimI-like enzyme